MNVKEIVYPHTGEALAAAVRDCLVAWGIKEQQVVMLVTDNGANIVKAIKLLSDRPKEETWSNDDEDQGSEGAA